MRKILSLFLCLALILTLSVPAFAADGAKVSVSWPTGTAVGGTFTLTVSCTENPGLSGAELALAYDTSVLQCTAVTTGAVLSGMMSAVNPAAEDGARLAAIGSGAVNGTGTLCTLTFTVLAEGDYGFVLNELYLLDADSGELPLTVTGLSYTAPTTPAETPETGSGITDTSYSDTVDHWAAQEIEDASDLGLVDGYGGGRYGPNDPMTRGQFATILWRYAGSPEPKGAASFTDLEPKATWYHQAVAWAEENGIMNGVGNGKFDPTGHVTREQLVTTLFRMSGGRSGGEAAFTGIYDSAFADSADISYWAKAAVYWAIYNSIWCNVDSLSTGTALFPRSYATRAQIAVMMTRYDSIDN